MYSKCPKCDYEFSWQRKWKLSAKKPYACPGCRVGLLKNAKSERYINLSMLLLLVPQIILGLVSLAKHRYHFTIPDSIELAICLLIAVPPLILGVVYFGMWKATARFETLDRENNPEQNINPVVERV